MLHPLVHRPHVLPTPARAAEIGPVVEVGGRTAHVDGSVEATRPAYDLAARQVEAAIDRVLLRRGEERPVLGGVPQLVGAAHVVDRGVVGGGAPPPQPPPGPPVAKPSGGGG